MEKNKNVVIVIGSKGVNATGLIRSLGEGGYYVVYASDYSCIESRWTKEYLKLSNNESVKIRELMEYINQFDKKPAIYPTDDTTSFFLDDYFDLLNEKCHLPNAHGKLRELADKITMANLASENGLIVPAYKKIYLKEKFDWSGGFPVILKPYAGYAGSKGDICICYSQDEYVKAISKFRDMDYKYIMAQKLLDDAEQYEIGIMGLSLPDGTVEIPGIIRKIRSYPNGRGSTSYAIYKSKIDCLDYNAIKAFVRSTGYIGLFDIEMIIVDNTPYFIEINYRNGQYGYMPTAAGYNLPVNWYKGMMGENIDKPIYVREIYYINERDDFRHVKDGNVSLMQWIKEFRKSQAYGMYHPKDIRPFVRQYLKIPDRIIIKGNKIKNWIKDLLIREEWSVAFRNKSDRLLFEHNSTKNEFMILPNSFRYWAADPFLFTHKGKHYVFFEMYDRFKAKGLIGYRELYGNGYGKMKIAFESDRHLSFPFIFEYNNEIFMMPESSNENCLMILKAEDFPNKWKKEKVLIEDKALCDSILFWSDKLYLMTQEIKDGIPLGILDLYYYEDEEWKKTNSSPIVSGADCARLAGNVIKHNGYIIRVAQNCAEEYGKKISFHRIERISNSFYEEEYMTEISVSDILVDDNHEYIGIHSYNMNDHFEVVDLKNKSKIKFGNVINIFVRICKKIYRK